jgi:hypothetical protein
MPFLIPHVFTFHSQLVKPLHDKIFVNLDITDPYGRSAGIRDGVMSILIGIGAGRSIESGKAINIEDLTDLKPKKVRS